MAITKVQSTGVTTGTIQLTGVTAGSLLVLVVSYWRGTTSGAKLATPTDTNGTFAEAVNDVPQIYGTVSDVGSAIFYIENANSGTHTVTITITDWACSFAEYSSVTTSGALDQHTSAKTASSVHLSQVTGTTGTTAQNNELVVIGCALAAATGAADVGFTDPVSGFTTLYKQSNDSSDIAHMSAYKVISSTGTQSATFNWTNNDSFNTSQASIATFKENTATSITPTVVAATLTGTQSVLSAGILTRSMIQGS